MALQNDDIARISVVVAGLVIVAFIFVYIPENAKPEHEYWTFDTVGAYEVEYLYGDGSDGGLGPIDPGKGMAWVRVLVIISIPENMTATLHSTDFKLTLYDITGEVELGEYIMSGPVWYPLDRDVKSTDDVKTVPLYFAVDEIYLDSILQGNYTVEYLGDMIVR